MPLPIGDAPTFTSWYVNVQVDNVTTTDAEYPKLCMEECKKNCTSTAEETKCFGKVYTSKQE